jgi:hypothetical protein
LLGPGLGNASRRCYRAWRALTGERVAAGHAERIVGRLNVEARLKSGLRVRALIRRCDLAAIGVAVVAKGDADAGAILVKLNGRDGGCTVLAEARRPDGAAVWLRATGAAAVAETDADAYIARQRGRDPDLWVIEIDSAAADALIDAPVVS